MGSFDAMPRLVARRGYAVRSSGEAVKLAPASPTELMHGTTHVVLNQFVKPVQINPVKVVSIAQAQGLGDDLVLRVARGSHFAMGSAGLWICVPCTTVIGRARSCEIGHL